MRKGFTLIEMVLVMSVIVIIFLLTVPNIQRTLNLVNDKACEAQLKVVDAAILQAMLYHDERPGSVDDLVRDGFLTERQTRCSNGNPIRVEGGQAVQ